jgi:hypothetical protein
MRGQPLNPTSNYHFLEFHHLFLGLVRQERERERGRERTSLLVIRSLRSFKPIHTSLLNIFAIAAVLEEE